MVDTPPSIPKRALQNLTPHDLNKRDRARLIARDEKRGDSRSTRKRDDSRDLIKTPNSLKKIRVVAQNHRNEMNAIRKTDSCRYVIEFPPGAMGLHLEPVITSHNPDRRLGCRVKAFHFENSYSGIDKSVLQSSISIGDVLHSIDGLDVYLSPFDDIFQMLRARITESKLIGFKIINSETILSKEPARSFNRKGPSTVSPESANTQSTPPRLTEVHLSTPRPTPRIPPVLSPENKSSPKGDGGQRVVPVTPRTPANLSFLASVDDLSLLHVDTLRSLFPVRFEELSHILNDLGANIGSSLLDAGKSFEGNAERVLGETVQHIPLYTREDLHKEQNKVKLLLQELSETCMRLGASDSQFVEAERELAEIKVSESREREKSAKSQSAIAALTSRLDDMGMELGAERADRDAWLARATAAEEENDIYRREFESLQLRYEQLEGEHEKYRQEAEASLREASYAHDRDEGEFEQELDEVRQQYDSLRAEMEEVVRKVRAEKVEIERERDIALAELEVMRDLSGSERLSVDKERSRIKEALNTQQKLHMQRILESEEECYQMKNECSELKIKLEKALAQNAQVLSAKQSVEYKLKASEDREIESRECVNCQETELKSLRDALQTASTENRDRKNECGSLRDAKAGLELQLEAAHRAAENIKRASESREQQLDKLQHDFMEAQREIINKDSALSEAKDLAGELRQELDSISKHSSDQLARLRSRTETREAELLGAVSVAEKRVAQMEVENEQRIAKYRASADSAQKKIDSLTSNLSNVSARFNQREVEFGDIDSQRIALEKDCRHLKSILELEKVRSERLESVRAANETELESLRSELQKLRHEYDEIKVNAESMRRLAFDANAQINLKCLEIDEVKERLDMSLSSTSALELQANTKAKELEKLRSDFEHTMKVLQARLPEIRTESAAIAEELTLSLSSTHNEIRKDIEDWLQLANSRKCENCANLSRELSDAKEQIAQTKNELDASLFAMASMQDKVDEWSARYSAAHVEVSNLENQWKNRSSVELIDGSMEYAVATQQSAQQIIGDATTMDRTAVEECAAVTSDIVSDESSQCDWQFKYSRELQEISAMHASIIHMVHNHPLAPESSGEGEDTAAESVESPEDEFDGVTQESAPSLEAFKAQLHHYHRRVVELEDNCNRLEKELLYAHGINTKLTADLETVRSAVANQRDSSVSVIHELKSKITEQLGAITDRDLQLKECNIQLVVARQRAEVDAVEHKKNVMQLTDRSAELEISIRQLKSEVASIAEEKSRVEFERDDLQVKLTSEENKIVTKVQRYESDMRDMRSEYESLRKVCADTEDKMLRCAERNAKMVSELTSENDSLRASVKEMTSSVESRHLTKIHDLEANLAASESAVATLTTKFEEELNQLRNDCASYQHSAETSERELMDSIKSLNILEIKYRHANQMCSQLQVEKSSPKREGSLSAKTDMEGDNESVESKPIPATTFSCESEDTNSPGEDDSNEIVSSLLSQLESVIQEAQSREQEWGIARTSLTAAIEEWRNRASAAMSQSLALEKSCVTMKNERVQLESDVQTLRERLRVADREVVKLKDIVHSLECEAVRSAGCDVGQNSGDTEDTDMVIYCDTRKATGDLLTNSHCDVDSVIGESMSSVGASRDSATSQASLYSSDGAADMDEWGNAFTSRDALSKTLISQLNAANATLAQVSGSLLEGRAREEQLKLQLFELQEQFINAATSSGTEHTEAVAATPDGTYSDGTWKAAVKMLLKAWRSTRAQLASQTSHTESRTESCQSYFTNEEMDYIRSIANEALSQELCEEVLADTARRESSDYVKHIQGAQRDDCGNPGSTPVMSPMRGCDADENESGLWYVSSFDEEPELSTCLVDT